MAAKRKDPPKRSEPLNWTVLDNEDDDKFYVWAFSGHSSGVDKYEALGFDVERYTVSGVRPGGKRRVEQSDVGKPIERNGHVLMSCSKARKAEIEQVGEDGSTGLQLAKKIDDAMSSKRFGQETLGPMANMGRGGNPYFKVINETEPAIQEGAR